MHCWQATCLRQSTSWDCQQRVAEAKRRSLLAHLMFPPRHLSNAWLDFICSITVKTSRNLTYQSMGFELPESVVIHIWLQSKLPLLPVEVKATFLCWCCVSSLSLRAIPIASAHTVPAYECSSVSHEGRPPSSCWVYSCSIAIWASCL